MSRFAGWAVAICLLLTGCGKSLRPDPNPYALISNVPTAEVVACGDRVLGLKSCAVERGQPLASVPIQVQGYNAGTVRVTSDNCGVEFDVRYAKNAAVDIRMPGLAQETCVLAISVQPEFPQERKSGLVIAALKAFVAIRVLEPGSEWSGHESKIALDADASLVLPSGRLLVRGCGAQVDRESGGRLKLSEMPNPGAKDCVYQGVVMGQVNHYFTWMVWRHAAEYVPAVEPGVSFDGKSVVIQADPATSVIAVDGSYYLANALSVKFDRQKSHIVRTLTIGGRNVVGLYDPKGGFSWRR